MKILFVSLGCDKNLVDSEHMSGLLSKAGYEFTDDETQADIIIINSCCFIKDAKEESIETIFEMARYKEEGQCKALVLAGCLAQRYHEEIKTEIPEVDICIGTTAIDSIVSALDDYFKEHKKKEYLKDIDFLAAANAPRNLSTMGSYAYLKIAEGCDKHCTYCIIPKVRGNYRSVKMEYLIDEAKKLAEQGVKELILVAQETTMYGKDIYGKKSLHILLKELAKISGIYWIRVLYCYPEEIYDELIDVIASEKKICNYLDLPIQHASDTILKKMGRRTTNKDLRDIIGKLRKRIPDIVLRTTLITGFPGETEEQFQDTLSLVEEVGYEGAFTFIFSPREGTPAARMEDNVSEADKKDRLNRLNEAINRGFRAGNKRFEGQIVDVLVEGTSKNDDTMLAGYTRHNKLVNFKGDASKIGQIVNVKITEAKTWHLAGEMVNDDTTN